MTDARHSILVISYSDDSRKSLSASLSGLDIPFQEFATFCEAEEIALHSMFNGILVDLQSMVKAKGDEKTVACSLTGFYPTLRVRTLGSMLVPMAMPGDSKQDSSLNEFLSKSCANFTPRKLRLYRRRDICVSCILQTLVDGDARAYTQNLSWGGAFIVTTLAEKFQVDDRITLSIPEFGLETSALVRWLQPWGMRRPPGIGIAFEAMNDTLENMLLNTLKHEKHNDRDRMVAR